MKKQKDRTMKFTEAEIMSVMAVLSSIIGESHVTQEVMSGPAKDFTGVYAKFDKIARAITNKPQLEEGLVRFSVMEGLGRLNDHYYQIQELIEDGTIEAFEPRE